MHPRRVNRAGFELVRRWEGLRLDAYQCSAKVWTIGWGHTGKDVEAGDRISLPQAEKLLSDDLARFARGVQTLVRVPVSDNEFAALVSLSFNIGLPAFGRSTLLRHLNAGERAEASLEFERWAYVRGTYTHGLLRRRLDEKELFLRPDESPKVA